jgi:hypothetical protein
MREERFDFRRTHFPRMPTAVEEHEATNPLDIGLLGAQAVVLEANAVADAVEEARSGIHTRGRAGSGVHQILAGGGGNADVGDDCVCLVDRPKEGFRVIDGVGVRV